MGCQQLVQDRVSPVHRYYDPATEQFLSVDPMVDETGTPYAYTDGDPVNGTDPSGLFCGAALLFGLTSASRQCWSSGYQKVANDARRGTIGGCIAGNAQLIGGIHFSVCVVHNQSGWSGGVSGGVQVGPSVGADATGGLIVSNATCNSQLNGGSGGLTTAWGEGPTIAANTEVGGRGRSNVVTQYVGGGFGANDLFGIVPGNAGVSASGSHFWRF